MTGNATLGRCSGRDGGAATLKSPKVQCRVARFKSLKEKALKGSLPVSMRVNGDGRVSRNVFVQIGESGKGKQSSLPRRVYRVLAGILGRSCLVVTIVALC